MILADTIAPELTSEHARSRLAEIRAVLAQIDWNDAGFILATRSRVLAEQLMASSRWVNEVVPSSPVGDSYEGYQAYYERLNTHAIQALDALRTHLGANPGDEAALADYRALLGVV
ncbi:hypothetical protein [Rhodococcus jostii]|uniref:hypothetical protein n=1 Tax=Rhodococcus jostii TaxID=132919 RepID=UPI00366634C9